ncbi:MAG TPA: hypothetical protein VI997_11230 [Candidatus Thermoplasmatota archaeon]|nr:hypothetical protein [Candidatus Thermoplasmatota archaeon]
MRGRLTVATAALAVLAGCITPSEAGPDVPSAGTVDAALPEVELLQDPAGDAWMTSAWVIRDGVQGWCRFVPRADEPCRDATTAMQPPDAGLVEAPPWMDVLSVGVTEEGRDIVLAIEVASLPEDARDLVMDDMAPVWEVCWAEIVADSCDFSHGAQRASFGVGNSFDGAPQLSAVFEVTWNENGTWGCNDWWWCMWAIPFELEPGTPGRIVMRVPRELVTTPDGLHDVQARALVTDGRFDPPVDGARVHGPGDRSESVGTPWWLRWFRYTVDRVEGSAEYTFRSVAPVEALPGLAAPGYYADASEDSPLAPTGLWLAETAEEVALSIAFREIPDPFQGLWLEAELAFGEGRLVYVWYDATDPGAVPGAWMCSDQNCSRTLAIPVRAVLVYGEEPRVDLVFPRVAIGSPGRGARTNLVEVDGSVGLEKLDGAVEATDRAGFWFTLAPYTFLMDTQVSQDLNRATLAQDGAGDVADVVSGPDPVSTPGWDRRSFDITSVDAQPAGEGAVRLSLGLERLVEVEPPPPFDAVLFSIGLGSAERSTLVGYYRADGEEKGTFFCADDTLLLGGDGRLPARDFWQIIDGVLSTTENDGQARSRGSGGGGSITFTMPLACVGDEESTALHADKVAAGTFALRSQGDEVRMLDEASGDGPFLIETAVVAAAAPWYAKPFGLDNFWDMFGIGAALITTGVGAAIVNRRRASLRRLLADVERAAALPTPAERDAALRSLRARLKERLTRGTIAEGQYVLVERRLDELLMRARVDVLTEAFDELPHVLLGRLQTMLADGTMSADDHRVFTALVDKARFLTPEAKREICDRAAIWVRQDAGSP